jgi:hypothetical protein
MSKVIEGSLISNLDISLITLIIGYVQIKSHKVAKCYVV